MVSVVQNVAIDCADAYGLARFWAEATGRPLDPDATPGDRETQVELADGGLTLYFNQVPEPKTVKNRVHLCLRPDTARDTEVQRLLALGATLVGDHRNTDGTGWAVLADPNTRDYQFCAA
ncbi:VOC family protein [Kitasatospora sp. CB01950]|uniref:VOC family protein n=1 Tax=Kitasatospora sp. CB01950 TaxID=1703930 RepID=UPI000939AC55|nr:VOC family protein [Kitasatospora sp. CB01950]OKJ13822.1 glyoxalase [Kitasatospora sp. CB01950]